jgi:transposase-like protein
VKEMNYGPKYTTEQRIEAVKEFKRTGNADQAAKQLGCVRESILAWSGDARYSAIEQRPSVDVEALYLIIGKLTAENTKLKNGGKQ